jgi:hypothetical protein
MCTTANEESCSVCICVFFQVTGIKIVGAHRGITEVTLHSPCKDPGCNSQWGALLWGLHSHYTQVLQAEGRATPSHQGKILAGLVLNLRICAFPSQYTSETSVLLPPTRPSGQASRKLALECSVSDLETVHTCPCCPMRTHDHLHLDLHVWLSKLKTVHVALSHRQPYTELQAHLQTSEAVLLGSRYCRGQFQSLSLSCWRPPCLLVTARESTGHMFSL